MYDKEDKIKVILEITNKLKEFPRSNGEKINLYDEKYSFVVKFKDLAVKWINTKNSRYEGSLYFEELNKYFIYLLPKEKKESYQFYLVANKFFK
tara:strand:+ start:185 stop:466 length:282 start_codon:yes stop_codon:yes gene_type:complete